MNKKLYNSLHPKSDLLVIWSDWSQNNVVNCLTFIADDMKSQRLQLRVQRTINSNKYDECTNSQKY
jgi:hypothetical protein